MRSQRHFYRVYFNRVGADPSRAWIVRREDRKRESYFSHVVVDKVVAETFYEPRNEPPVPKGWLSVYGILTVIGTGKERKAVIQ